MYSSLKKIVDYNMLCLCRCCHHEKCTLQLAWYLHMNTDLAWTTHYIHLLSVLHRDLAGWVLFSRRSRVMGAKEREWRSKQSINFKTKQSSWVLNLKGWGHKRRKRCRERSQTINYLGWNFPLPWNGRHTPGAMFNHRKNATAGFLWQDD